MAAAGTFGVEGVNRASLDGGDRVFHEAGFIQGVGVDAHLHIHPIGHRQAGIDGGGRGAPVFVQLQAAGAGAHLFFQGFRGAGVAFAEKAQVHRQAFRCLKHSPDVEGAGGAGGGIGAGGRSGAAAHQGGDAAGQGRFDLLGTDEVDVGVDATGREDVPFPSDGFRAGTHHDRHPLLGVGVAGFADAHDPAVLEADIGFDDAPPVEDQGIGDHRVDGTLSSRGLGLAHAVANPLAAAELHLIAVDGEVLLDFQDQIGVGEANPVAGGGSVGLGVGLAGDAVGHGSGVEGSVDLAVETDHPTIAGQGNQVHVAAVAGFEADGRAGGDVEPLTAGCGPVELQGGIGFSEVEMGAHLHRPVAAVGDAQRGDGSACIQLQFTRFGKQFAWNERCHGFCLSESGRAG